MSDKQSGIREGDPIFVESLLSYAEWRARMKKYPNTSNLAQPREVFDFKPGNMKWRHQMGNTLAPGEIHTINLALIKLRKERGLLPKHDSVRSGDGHWPGLPFTP